eukprot:GHVL01012100.1.p1 GENE.GHVL01012100.1~~GHVL01012100.1.p1  ORF type:complete len:488 (+),score=80.83 GHVL01012100.1:46-1509(+)
MQFVLVLWIFLLVPYKTEAIFKKKCKVIDSSELNHIQNIQFEISHQNLKFDEHTDLLKLIKDKKKIGKSSSQKKLKQIIKKLSAPESNPPKREISTFSLLRRQEARQLTLQYAKLWLKFVSSCEPLKNSVKSIKSLSNTLKEKVPKLNISNAISMDSDEWENLRWVAEQMKKYKKRLEGNPESDMKTELNFMNANYKRQMRFKQICHWQELKETSDPTIKEFAQTLDFYKNRRAHLIKNLKIANNGKIAIKALQSFSKEAKETERKVMLFHREHFAQQLQSKEAKDEIQPLRRKWLKVRTDVYHDLETYDSLLKCYELMDVPNRAEKIDEMEGNITKGGAHWREHIGDITELEIYLAGNLDLENELLKMLEVDEEFLQKFIEAIVKILKKIDKAREANGKIVKAIENDAEIYKKGVKAFVSEVNAAKLDESFKKIIKAVAMFQEAKDEIQPLRMPEDLLVLDDMSRDILKVFDPLLKWVMLNASQLF